MDSNEAVLVARVKWDIACERMSLEIAPQSSDFWDDAPRDFSEAVQFARVALDELQTAYARARCLV